MNHWGYFFSLLALGLLLKEPQESLAFARKPVVERELQEVLD
jgi:hypothetical protein